MQRFFEEGYTHNNEQKGNCLAIVIHNWSNTLQNWKAIVKENIITEQKIYCLRCPYIQHTNGICFLSWITEQSSYHLLWPSHASPKSKFYKSNSNLFLIILSQPTGIRLHTIFFHYRYSSKKVEVTKQTD